MKNNNYEIDNNQLEKVSGGDSGLDPNNMTPEERAMYGANARKYILENNTLERLTEKYISILEKK